ncbi:GAF domain-containing protein [Egbenema bharatensis]|uniref:GAF domain-containing protein n=1 Tax=Egbenema bharatensis TaxID=3463334 RepID=UPI003A858577
MSALNVQSNTVQSNIEHPHLTALLAELSQILTQPSTIAEMVQHVADAIVQTLNDIALLKVWLLNSEQTLLELQAASGIVSHGLDLPDRIPVGISIIGLIAQNRTPYFTNDLSHDICFNSHWIQQEQLLSFAGYPLVLEDRLVGVMALFSRQPISEATGSLLQWATTSLAISVDRVLARQELLSRRETLLFRLANQIRNSLDLDKILGTAVREIRQLLHIDRCHFLWCWTSPHPSSAQEEVMQPILCITHEARQPELPSLLGECSPEQVAVLANKILSLQPIQIAAIDRVRLEPEIVDLMQQWGMQSQLLMPLETRSGQLGAIVCGHCQDTHLWNESDVELLQAVTDQLAIAIDQAELYAQSRAAALAAQTQAEQLSEALTHLRQTQTQLIQSEKMSSLGQLVAGIAHEINNPVTFVSGNLTHANRYFQDLAHLLKLYEQHYPEPVPEIQECIESVDFDFVISDFKNVLNSMRIGADRIYKIVVSLRNFSRLDESEVKAVDLHEGIDSTLLILQNRLKAKGQSPGIEVIKHYGSLPLVNCYASQLNQVFMNLISNAIDALENAPLPHIITIHTEFLSAQPTTAIGSPKPSWIVIKIGDNGTGMTEEVKQRIFDPFYTTKPVGHGTGLGLSISHQIIVEKHKGRLSCQSYPGQGTTFIIEVPFYETVLAEGVEVSKVEG